MGVRKTVLGAGDFRAKANLQIGWPICQSQIAQPICKWDDQSENLFEALFCKCQTHTVLSQTLLLFELMVSTKVSRIE